MTKMKVIMLFLLQHTISATKFRRKLIKIKIVKFFKALKVGKN
jgi:hypothetical protein